PPPATMVPGMPCKPCSASFDCVDCGAGCNCLNAPPRSPLWQVPFSARGDDGWKASSQPLCVGLQSITGHAIWADRRGVFTAVSGTSFGPSAVEVPDDDAGVVAENVVAGDFAARTRVFHNEGTGWSLRADLIGSREVGLTAASAAKLIIYGDLGDQSEACALGVLSGAKLECEKVLAVRAGFAVNETRAFALAGAGIVLESDGQSWISRSGPMTGARAIWADDDDLVVVGLGGLVQRMVDDAWVSENVGSEAALTAVWGRNGDDLWVGDAAGRVLHFDGTSWQEIAQLGGVTCSRMTPIAHISGAGAHVWIHTSLQLARWDGSELESFGNWSCAPLRPDQNFDTLQIEDISAVSEDDVFIALSDSAGASCGDVYAVHYDGSEFHRF
ncbi:MAG TPA: hypothetical protein VK509_08010, partial [Polyangiales bacterium]|nr:hypothetical protein [Polyangiales bacterium]